MKYLLPAALSLLICGTSIGQRSSKKTTTNSNLTQVTQLGSLKGSYAPSVVKKGNINATSLIQSNGVSQFPQNKVNSSYLLNIGLPFTSSSQTATLVNTKTPSLSNNPGNTVIVTNTPGPNVSLNNMINNDGRNLPLNKDGKLLSVDGNVVEFNVPSSSSTSSICSSPIPTMVDGNKNAACGFIVPRDNPVNRDLASVGTTKYFQVRWLVFTDGGPTTNIDQTRINQLMAELNADYAAHNMVFCADPATIQEDPVWYTHNSGTDEFPMKDLWNVTPTQVINIYVVGSMTAGGYARMPYDPNGGVSNRGGIVLNRSNMWIGSHTVAHEMGHVMGLFHTFSGVSEQSSCSNCYERVRNVNGSSNTTGLPTPLGGPYTTEGDQEGDWCSDTHPNPQNSSQCPGPAGATGGCDLFARVPANFPVDNHMSYSFCTSIFTLQQQYRMHGMVDDYLFQWSAYGGGVCGSQPPVANFVGTPTTWVAPNNVTFTDLSLPSAIVTGWTWTFDIVGGNGVTCVGCVGPNAIFTGQTPPVVTYPNVGAYDVELTITSANGPSTETKLAYINVIATANDCDTLDADWFTPAPTPTWYTGAFGNMTGVPAEGSNLPGDDAGFYQQYFTPAAGTPIVGALTVGLAELTDPDDDMTFQIVVYEDDAGNPGFPDWGAGPVAVRAFSPSQIGVPLTGSGFYQQFNIPFTCAPTIVGATFHVGVEMFPGDATDQLILISNADGEGGSPLTNTYLTTFCASSDYNVGGHNCGYVAIDFDLLCYPQMGWYRPTGLATGFNETVVCDTTDVTIFTATLYDGETCVAPSGPNTGMVSWTYVFADGTTYNSTTEIDSFNISYTIPGPDTLTIMTMNDCGRADTTVWIIPYNFLPTPDGEFVAVQPNPVCDGPPGVDFNANSNGYQDYTWDFGDGTVQSSGDTAAVNHVYTTPGLYYTSLTVTSTGYQPIDILHFEDFEAGWPAGYARFNNDAFTPNAGVNPPFTGTNATAWLDLDIGGDGNTTAASTSWNQLPAQQGDDWMMTSAIVIPNANQMLTWDAVAEDPLFQDGYEVRISTTTQTTAAATTVLFSTLAENSFTTQRSISLAAYNGQTVYIAFRNNSTNEFILSIDDIWVGTTGPGCTATITKTDYVEIVDCSVQPPLADLLATDSTGCAPLSITFTDNTSQVPDITDTWLWNFGDGNFSSLQNPPSHVYPSAGTYFVSMQACNAGGCTTDYLTVIVGTGTVSVAGANQTICGGTIATLAGNDPNPDTGLWTLISGSGVPTSPTAFNSGVTGLAAGANVFEWTITGAGCVSSSQVTITIVTPPNAGTTTTLAVCSTDGTTDLYTLLGGADLGGAWTGPSALGGGDQGTYTPGTSTAGVYTYTITGVAPCANATATVTVTENVAANAGTTTTLSVCSTDGTTDLYTLLGGADLGGAWTGPSALGGGDQGTYTPGTSTAGVYTYTVTGVAPCANSIATVTVTESVAGNAGTTTTLAVCSTDGTTDLYTLLGGADLGGAWTGPSALGGGDQGTYTPGTSTAGVYTYTVTGVAPCANVTATVTVTENVAGNAGTTTTLSVCSTDGTTDLYTLLGGADLGGAWTGPSALGGGDQGTYTPGTSTAGVYTYTITGVAPCANSIATVTVTESVAPNAGTTTTLAVCSTDGTTDLYTLLGGADLGGAWTGPSALGGGDQGTYTPGTSTAGVYTYTVTGVAPCANAIATVTVTESVAPNAGTTTTFGICTTAPAADLLPLLGGADNGGVWTGPSPLAGGDLGTFDPASNLAGVYTYTLTGLAPCANAVSTVTVTITAGDDATFAYADFCAGSGGTPGLINTPGGTFSFNPNPGDGSTITSGGVIANEVGGSTYNVQYTTPAGPCQSSSTIPVNIITPANAGTTTTLSVCSTDGTTDLYTLLGGADLGGAWTGPSALGGGDQGTYTPGTSTAGVYTYTVTGVAPCANSIATVTVTENVAGNAGTTTTLSVCSTDGTTDLYTLLGGADLGGVWSPVMASGTGVFDPSTDVGGVYTYTITNAPCAPINATVTVTITTAANAGTNNTLTTCSTAGTTDLFALLGGADIGGVWSPVMTSGTGVFDPATDAAGVYTYTLTGVAPCANATATVTVTINSAGNAGTNNTLTACSSDGATDLFTLLGGADVGGVWTPALISGTGVFDPSVDAGGVYIYTITNAPCAPVNATITVTVNASPNGGTNNTLIVCDTDPTVDLFGLIAGADIGGVWSPVLTSGTGVFDPVSDAAGTYTYTLTGIVPCGNTSTTVDVTIDNSGCNTEPFYISNMLTPNNDLSNDFWYIGNVSEIQGSLVQIFNRWGAKLYETNNYNNDWDGIYNGSELPDGTYYYVIEHNGEVLQGPITLLRTKK